VLSRGPSGSRESSRDGSLPWSEAVAGTVGGTIKRTSRSARAAPKSKKARKPWPLPLWSWWGSNPRPLECDLA